MLNSKGAEKKLLNVIVKETLTYWLIKMIAMSSFVVNSLNASSICFTVVSKKEQNDLISQ